MSKIMSKPNRQSGMSLIEILVVLGIIVTIGATVARNVFGSREKSKVKVVKLQITKVENAVNEFYNDCDQLPDSLGQLIDEPGSDVCESWGLGGAYAKEKDLIDPWKNELVYELTDQSFTITSLGKDGAPGGEKLNKDISSEDM